MAASTTLLGWSLYQYKDAYQASGQLENMYDCIRWPLEWFIKCHTGQNELYVQVSLHKIQTGRLIYCITLFEGHTRMHEKGRKI